MKIYEIIAREKKTLGWFSTIKLKEKVEKEKAAHKIGEPLNLLGKNELLVLIICICCFVITNLVKR